MCNGFAVSASRLTTMDRYSLHPDPCDYRLIRLNNCLQVLACVCDILALFDRNLRQLARIIDCIANLFYYSLSGCMTAQTAHEINKRSAEDDQLFDPLYGTHPQGKAPGAPATQQMDREDVPVAVPVDKA